MVSSVSVVVPTYRSASTLSELVQRISTTLTMRDCQFEILLIDDASPDDGATWATVQELAGANSQLRGFRLLRNRGQHNSLLLGIRESKYDVIVTIDDDLQSQPEDIPRLLDALEAAQADVVYGVPRVKKHGALQNFGSLLVRRGLAVVLGSEHARYASSFRVFRVVLRDSFQQHKSSRVSIDALLGWGATKFCHVDVDHKERQQGNSGYSFRKLFGHMLTMVTSYSTIPLRIASLIGFSLFVVGVGLFIYAVVGKLTGLITEPGFAFLVSMFSLIGGAQLLALGIIGEYISTIFLRSMGMPAYTLAEKTDA